MKDLIRAVVVDAILFWLPLYLWKFHGYEGAGNVFLFIAWVCSSLLIITAIALIKDPSLLRPISPLRKIYSQFSSLAEIVAIAWFGHFFLAITLTVAYLLMVEIRAKGEKESA